MVGLQDSKFCTPSTNTASGNYKCCASNGAPASHQPAFASIYGCNDLQMQFRIKYNSLAHPVQRADKSLNNHNYLNDIYCNDLQIQFRIKYNSLAHPVERADKSLNDRNYAVL
jgi:hypothetical protein